jgi:acetyl-CoA C-acetyltransferase
MQQIANGDADIIVAGGQESDVDGPACAHMRSGTKMGDLKMIDTMLKDGLLDAFHGYHMGNTPRTSPRAGSLPATSRTVRGRIPEQGRGGPEGRQFKDEIRPVTLKGPQGRRRGRGRRIHPRGNHHRGARKAEARLLQGRHGDGRQRLGHQRRRGGAGSDDAAEAQRRGLTPLARIASWATAGVDPAIMGTGPIPSSRRALEKAGWKVSDLDLVEANEAFAAQACAVNKDMGWDPEIVNVNGGAIAIGHPIGASGARVLTTLLHEMGKRDSKKGLATLCIGGGMGVAMCLER